ncbi:hypothetical protein HLI_21225 (plasmid) [Halobacillus litoralis]|uniref:PXO1-76 n=2 Tax=Halobacillus litoralis TaxID=45668 RepID=A0A410MJG3_9BACI|nr:hypothetical protein HLI_21225 [Halobacillus litoralis]
MIIFGLAIYIFARKMEKKPILPWKGNGVTSSHDHKSKKKNKPKKHEVELDEEPNLFRDFLSDVKEIDNHMLRYHNNKFVLYAEVNPVNYFLLSQEEQEAIDVSFERWLAQLNYNVQFYLQNRYVDLSVPIQQMRESMMDADNLHDNAIQYGRSLVEDLVKWQTITPRYETKRYLLFTHTVNSNDITAEDREELEQKIVEKAFAELYRRFNTAKSQLRKANMDVELLTNEGIGEVLYHTFNRRKAVKNRYQDFGVKEMLALYVTAEQDNARIELVKEGVDDEIAQENHEQPRKAEEAS